MTSKQRPGVLFTLVGPAGAGKSSLMKYVLARTPLRQLPTATTRAIRSGEQQGREHLFVTPEEFRRMIDAGDLLEHQIIHENLYGMPRATVEAALDAGDAIIADIEVLGAARACADYPDNVISIFIEPPSIGVLIDRMRTRNESAAEIGKRLLRVPMELAYAPHCEYVIYNDDFDAAAERLHAIVADVLSGEPNAVEAGEPHEYHFSYFVRVLPIFGSDSLQSVEEPRVPAFQFSTDEHPHYAVLRYLRDTLGIDPREDALVCGDKPDGSYLPPLDLSYDEDVDGEHITYTYAYQLDSRIDAPMGWRWTPLSETVQIAVIEGNSDL